MIPRAPVSKFSGDRSREPRANNAVPIPIGIRPPNPMLKTFANVIEPMTMSNDPDARGSNANPIFLIPM